MWHPSGNAPGDVRHVATRIAGDVMEVYFTRIGDVPECIYKAFIHLKLASKIYQGG